VRRGAASCRAVPGSCPVATAVRAAAPVPSPPSRPGWPSAPRCRDPARSGRPAGGRRSRGCPDAGQAGHCPVRLVRSAVGTSVQPVERTSSVRASSVRASGVQASGVQASGVQASGVQASGASGCPDGQASGVRALPRCPRRAGPWSGSVWRAAPRLGAAGRRAAVVRGRRGRLLASGLTGSDGRTLAMADSHEGRAVAQGRRLAGFPAVAPPGRRAGCRPGGESIGGAGAHRPCRVSWAVVGVVPDHGPGLGGGDHAGWSVGWWWSRGVQLRRVHAVRWGAACGRSAAAADEERCPPGTERALARENSGGRDRV
jgi:hypothetical protein